MPEENARSAEDGAPGPLDELADRARSRHVVVVGGGIGGLVAALECARVGIRVTLLEREERCGGLIREAELDGMRVELGATATRAPEVAALAAELGLDGEAPDTDATWIGGLPGAAPLPAATVLGIPANPWVDDVRRVIGWRGAWRAYVDRLRPPLTIGRERSLGRLVATRMGTRVRDRLVAPLAEGGYGVAPELVDVDVAVPGLNPALTRTGSLSGAAGELAAPETPVTAPPGGLSRLVDALVARLETLGAEVRTGVEVRALERDGRSWTVRVGTAGDPDEGADAAGPEGIAADAVVVAASPSAARALLAPVVPGLPAAELPEVRADVVALVVTAPGLDAAPRGARVLPVPGTSAASAVEHESARWPRLRAGGRAVLRIRFPAAAVARLGDAETVELARREASALLGTALPADAVRAAVRVRLESAPPATLLGHEAAAAAVRAAVAAVPGLGVTGGWTAGAGLGSILPDARREADRLRRVLLWGPDTPSP
jgi:protoporphyrinogen/coproporphyrinogen III oxidase